MYNGKITSFTATCHCSVTAKHLGRHLVRQSAVSERAQSREWESKRGITRERESETHAVYAKQVSSFNCKALREDLLLGAFSTKKLAAVQVRKASGAPEIFPCRVFLIPKENACQLRCMKRKTWSFQQFSLVQFSSGRVCNSTALRKRIR